MSVALIVVVLLLPLLLLQDSHVVTAHERRDDDDSDNANTDTNEDNIIIKDDNKSSSTSKTTSLAASASNGNSNNISYDSPHQTCPPSLGASAVLVLAADNHVHRLGQHPARSKVVQRGGHSGQPRLLLAVDEAEGERHLRVPQKIQKEIENKKRRAGSNTITQQIISAFPRLPLLNRFNQQQTLETKRILAGLKKSQLPKPAHPLRQTGDARPDDAEGGLGVVGRELDDRREPEEYPFPRPDLLVRLLSRACVFVRERRQEDEVRHPHGSIVGAWLSLQPLQDAPFMFMPVSCAFRVTRVPHGVKRLPTTIAQKEDTNGTTSYENMN